mgnify:CR=1 FL=1
MHKYTLQAYKIHNVANIGINYYFCRSYSLDIGNDTRIASSVSRHKARTTLVLA